MDLTTTFSHQCKLQAQTLIRNTSEVSAQHLHIVRGLEKGIMAIDEDLTKCAIQFSDLAPDILKQLLERGHGTSIEVYPGQLELELKEMNGTISMSLKMGKCKVTSTINTSLQNLQQKLINDIVYHFEKYPKAALDLTLKHIQFIPQDDNTTSYTDIIVYIMNCPDKDTYTELKIAAAHLIFRHQQEYRFEFTQWASYYAFKHEGTFSVEPYKVTANHFVHNQESPRAVLELIPSSKEPNSIKDHDALIKLSLCLQENFEQKNGSTTITPVIVLCERMLHELIESSPDTTDISVRTTHLRICQINADVELCLGTESSKLKLANTSFKRIQRNLINNLILKDKNGVFSNYTINLFLKLIITSVKNCPEEFNNYAGFYKEVVRFIIDDPRRKITGEVKFETLRHVFKFSENYSARFIVALQSARAVIRLTKDCQTKNVTDAVRYIIESSELSFPHESMMSASLYIVLNPHSFSPHAFAIAAKHIINNKNDYPQGFVNHTATIFIKENAGFFNEAINSQRSFVHFYRSNFLMDALEVYSDFLTEVLESDNRTFPDPNKPTSQVVTILDLWWMGIFDQALENEKVCIFLLNHAEDITIIKWNSRNRKT